MRRPAVLILKASNGDEQNQAANVIAEELKNKGFKPVLVDLLKVSLNTVKRFQTKLRLLKNVSFKTLLANWFTHHTFNPGVILPLYKRRLLKLLQEHKPVFLISTIPFQAASNLLTGTGVSIPIYAVISDYFLRRNWIHPSIDHYFVSTDSVKKSLLNLDISDAKITVSGIPVSTKFETKVNCIFEKYFLSPYKKIILVNADQGILKDVKNLCQQLLQNPTHQIVAVCGKNDRVFRKLIPLAYRYPDSFRLLEEVSDIHNLFSVSQCIVTKPGEKILSQAAACGVPLILYKPESKQQSERAYFFSDKGAAYIAASIHDAFEYVQGLSRNKRLLEDMKTKIAGIHIKNAATSIIHHALNSLQKRSHIQSQIELDPHPFLSDTKETSLPQPLNEHVTKVVSKLPTPS